MSQYFPPYNNTKLTSIENQIMGFTKNTLDNLADITKLKVVDTSNFVAKLNLLLMLML